MAQVLQETRRESVMSAAKLSETAKGVYIIAATPFTDDGALDLQSVDTLTDFYLQCGVTDLRCSE